MKITKSQLGKIIKEELLEATRSGGIGVHDTTRGPHDKRPPTEPVYNRQTEDYIINDIESLRERLAAIETFLQDLAQHLDYPVEVGAK